DDRRAPGRDFLRASAQRIQFGQAALLRCGRCALRSARLRNGPAVCRGPSRAVRRWRGPPLAGSLAEETPFRFLRLSRNARTPKRDAQPAVRATKRNATEFMQ